MESPVHIGKRKLVYIVVQLMPFIILYALSKTIFKELYLFEWTARHVYLYIWLLVLIYASFGRTIISLSLTLGNIAGIFIGQFAGDYIRLLNMQKITENMSAELRYRLQHHPGFELWIGTVLIFFIIGNVTHILLRKKAEVSFNRYERQFF